MPLWIKNFLWGKIAMLLCVFFVLLLVSEVVMRATNNYSVYRVFSLLWLVSLVYICIDIGLAIYRHIVL